jgi:GTP:adenosylcobinamide-phosphate guanylyltransferase
MPGKKLTAIVLAGDRGPEDPLARHAGVSCKALVPVAGQAMVLRVLDALENSSSVGDRIVCGSSARLLDNSPELTRRLAAENIHWVENEPSPSLSALAALNVLPPEQPVLLTTADHALLTSQMVDGFCRRAAETEADIVVGLAHAETVMKAFPENRRTITRLRDARCCGCNLFAFLTPRGRRAAEFWRRVEKQRKHPLKIIRTLGPLAVFRYLGGRLTLAEGLTRLSTLMEAQTDVVWMPEPEAAVDVDKIDDWILAEKILAAGRLEIR